MNYKFDSIVSRSEANALKEMIFQRVRERSEAMTDDVQADIMNVARESFVSQNNPFSQIINSQPQKTEQVQNTNVDTVEIAEKTEPLEIGFPQKTLSSQAVSEENAVREQIATIAYQSAMSEARQSLSNKKSFMGALDFLNSQAAVSLMRTNRERFEVIG